MAKFPLYLLLLLSLLRTSDALAQACYCTTPWTSNPTFGQACTANADCWACQQGAYSTSWQQAFCGNIYQAPQICNTEVQFQTQLCPINQSGIITQSRTKVCPSGVWTEWQTTQNTCTPNPPTCQVSTQSQTLSCQVGYVGNITQVQTSTCPNPYGQPIWSGSWITSQNTCTKSVTNPTNITSPVSPVSPINALTTPTPPVTAPQTPVLNSQTTMDGSLAPKAESSAPSSTAQTGAKGTTSETPTPKSPFTLKTIPLALSLELFSKPFAQPNVFPDLNIGQELPNDIKMMQNIYMDLITNGSLFNPDQSDKLKRIASDAVELEQ